MNMKDREKSLIKNTGILALGTFCSKFVSFFLLPLYTTVLTTEDYGTIDVLQTISSLAMPFITFQLCSGVFRFIIDSDEKKNKETIITTGVLVEAFSVISFSIIVFLVSRFWNIQYCGLFVLYFSSMAFLEMTQNITRGFGNTALYSIMSFIMTTISVTANIIMIVGLGMKGDSILIASSSAFITAGMLACIRQKLWSYISIASFSRKKLKEMLQYCLPLIPNAISWWIANTSDRLLIRIFLGASSNGIYAAANKIPTIYTTIFNVYNIAWIESLARGASDKHQTEFINTMYKRSLQLFGCICLGIICCMSICFNLLIGEQYKAAYPHIYVLLVAIFFNSVCSLLGGIFTAFKRSDVIGKTTVIGAIVNIFVNFALIKILGLYAASLSTLVSYIVIVIVRYVQVRKIMDLRWPIRFVLEYITMLILTSIGYFVKNVFLNIVILAILILWSVYNNKELMEDIFSPVMKRIRKKGNGSL